MAEMNYDEFKVFEICLSAVSSKDCGLFFLVWFNRCGRLLATAFSNFIRRRIASER
ncbi:hypothetical protein QUA03_12230 [Microcoleus sp. S36b_A4]